MNPRRVPGKVLTYAGLFLTGVGMIGVAGPHLELQRSGRVMAEVVGNDLAYQREGVYSFRLQLKYTKADGEMRTAITTPVRASSEEEARRNYRGKNFEKGKTYEIHTAAQDPDRLEPFKGYNWNTFGKWGVIALAGVILFVVGMRMTRR